jgi:hypothetical protein
MAEYKKEKIKPDVLSREKIKSLWADALRSPNPMLEPIGGKPEWWYREPLLNKYSAFLP